MSFTFCCVRHCSNTTLNSSVKFYSLPTEKERREEWICALKGKTKLSGFKEVGFVCSEHFVTGEMNKSNSHVDYVPSLFEADPNWSQDCYEEHPRKKVAKNHLLNAKVERSPDQIPFPTIHMEECQSCGDAFSSGISLFRHIQENCYQWYTVHGECWKQLFESMNTPELECMEEISPTSVVIQPENTDEENIEAYAMEVNEYYYSRKVGHRKYKNKLYKKKFNCYSCDKWLQNNIRFMGHVQHKILKLWSQFDFDENLFTCAFCFRQFGSLFNKQCHIEMVHGPNIAQTTCRICELYFGDDQSFLDHMKKTHYQNEMPFICNVCKYSSSFYQDVVNHFQETHDNTDLLQCSFCLQILSTAKEFLTHAIIHIKHRVWCRKCRLQFHSKIEMEHHLLTDHMANHLIAVSDGKGMQDFSKARVHIFVHRSYRNRQTPSSIKVTKRETAVNSNYSLKIVNDHNELEEQHMSDSRSNDGLYLSDENVHKNNSHQDIITESIINEQDTPLPPPYLEITEISPTTVKLKWEHPDDCIVTNYKLVFKGSKSSTVKMLSASHTTAKLVDLIPDTDYVFRIYTLFNNLQSSCVETKCRTDKHEMGELLPMLVMKKPPMKIDHEEDVETCNDSHIPTTIIITAQEQPCKEVKLRDTLKKETGHDDTSGQLEDVELVPVALNESNLNPTSIELVSFDNFET